MPLTPDELTRLADHYGLWPCGELAMTLRDSEGGVMEVFATAMDGDGLWVLNTAGQIWCFRGAYPTRMDVAPIEVDGEAKVEVTDLAVSVPFRGGER